LKDNLLLPFIVLHLPDRMPDVFCDALSTDIVDQKSKPDTFVFSEDRERMAQDGTDKAEAAHKQITHAVLKKLKSRFLGHPHYRWDDTYIEIEQAFRLRREADFEEYEYRRTHPRTEFYGADFFPTPQFPHSVASKEATTSGSISRRSVP
jgi:hypothetical protein